MWPAEACVNTGLQDIRRLSKTHSAIIKRNSLLTLLQCTWLTASASGDTELLLSPPCLFFHVHLIPFPLLLHTWQDFECIVVLIFFSAFVNSFHQFIQFLVCFLSLPLLFSLVLPGFPPHCCTLVRFPPYLIGLLFCFVFFFSLWNSSSWKSSLLVLLILGVSVWHNGVHMGLPCICVTISYSPSSPCPFHSFSEKATSAHHVYSITAFPLILARFLPLISWSLF